MKNTLEKLNDIDLFLEHYDLNSPPHRPPREKCVACLSELLKEERERGGFW